MDLHTVEVAYDRAIELLSSSTNPRMRRRRSCRPIPSLSHLFRTLLNASIHRNRPTQPIRHSPALLPVSRVTRTLDNHSRVEEEEEVPRTCINHRRRHHRPIRPTRFRLETLVLPLATPFAHISQTTLLHSVSFRIRVHATFRNTSHQTERVSTITIQISLHRRLSLEVEDSVGSAYHKKHDRTARKDQARRCGRRPSLRRRGWSSYSASGLPPPIEERDPPPPISFPSSSSRDCLPTFLESEEEIFIPTLRTTMRARMISII
jgi:hypothetical protein